MSSTNAQSNPVDRANEVNASTASPRHSTVLRTNQLSETELYRLAHSITGFISDIRHMLYLAGLDAMQATEATDEFLNLQVSAGQQRKVIQHGAKLFEAIAAELNSLDHEWALEGYDS